MATLSTALGIATGALQADQSALDVVANNTANANTPGYTRQTALWQEQDAVTLSGESVGAGTQFAGATSQRNRVLEAGIQQQTQQTAASSSRLTALQSVQAIFSDALTTGGTDTQGGIGGAISGFFNSFSQLATNASDTTLRQQVISSAGALAQSFQSAASQLQQQSSALDAQSAGIVSQVNALSTSIAGINREIERLSPGSDAGTLEDQRQYQLSQLSQLVGIHTIRTEDNGLTVTTASGDVLVAKDQAVALSTGTAGGQTHIFSGSTDITADLQNGGGQIGGLLTVRNQDIPQISQTLDQLAYGIATQVNAANQAGTGSTGASGAPIFTPPPTVAGAARTFTVAITNPNDVAAAATGQSAGDNQNANLIANLANQPIVSGASPSAYYATLVSTVGSLVSGVSTENTTEQATLTQLQGQRDQLSAVNLNDEAATLQTYEQSYQAASKVFTIIGSVIASALNLGVPTAVN